MPQEHYVLRCYSCETFQVHIVKKSKKWGCKMCGAKQSFIRHYGKGNARDCRSQVIRLSEIKMKKEVNEMYEMPIEEETININPASQSKPCIIKTAQRRHKILNTSKWTEYIDDDDDDDNVVNLSHEDNQCSDSQSCRDNCNEKINIHNDSKIDFSKKKIVNIIDHMDGQSSGSNCNFNVTNEVIDHAFMASNLESKDSSEAKKYCFNTNQVKNNTVPHSMSKSTNMFGSNHNDFDDLININF